LDRSSGWSTAASIGDLAAALYYGPTPVPEAIRRCRRLIEEPDRGGEAHARVFLGGLEAMRGRFVEARRFVERAEVILEELGQGSAARRMCAALRGQVELLAGNHADAAQVLQASYDDLEASGDRAYLATCAAELAEAVYLTGRYVEATHWSRTAEELAALDDIPTQFLWRAVRAKLLAIEGSTIESETLAREAVRLAESTDSLNQCAKVLLDLANVLNLLGRARDAAEECRRALALFQQKGNVVGTAWVRALLEQLAGT
jgi:tetratricopeptide (TPR) repeat protein